MVINIRNKERQTGKTSDIIELAEILLSLDRKIVLLVHNRQALEYLKRNYKGFLKSKSNMIVGSATDLSFLRGHRCDTILVDEWSLLQTSNELKSFATICSAIIYATDNIAYKEDLFSGKPI